MIISGYISKPVLYSLVDNKLKDLGISYHDYPISSIEIAERHQDSLIIEKVQFPTTNIGGIIFKGEHKSSMALNTLRSKKGQNFDCMHELIHFWFHPPGERLCVEDSIIRQNKGLEWQANEGAAQGLMPEKLFIEKYKQFKGDIPTLSDFFVVGEKAVEFRVNNLNLYKISFNNPIIDLGSLNKNPLHKISTQSGVATRIKKARYCPQCHNLDIPDMFGYCKVCGNELLGCASGGDGMNYYEGVELDKNGRALKCPKCENHDIKDLDSYCKICGTYLFQRCLDYTYEEDGIIEKGCGNQPDSNARYCSECGHMTSFLKNGALSNWLHEKNEIESDDIPF